MCSCFLDADLSFYLPYLPSCWWTLTFLAGRVCWWFISSVCVRLKKSLFLPSLRRIISKNADFLIFFFQLLNLFYSFLSQEDYFLIFSLFLTGTEETITFLSHFYSQHVIKEWDILVSSSSLAWVLSKYSHDTENILTVSFLYIYLPTTFLFGSSFIEI